MSKYIKPSKLGDKACLLCNNARVCLFVVLVLCLGR